MGMETFEQLEAWKRSHTLVLLVYKLTGKLPNEERYGLQAQMRRAAVSIPANIAEGFKRRGVREKSRFYNIAHASLEELRYYLGLCADLNYFSSATSLSALTDEIGKMLTGLVRANSLQR